MTEQNDTDQGGDQAFIEQLSPLVKAYIDKHVENAIKQHEESQTNGNKWRNSWRSASPITKGSFIMTAAIAGATIAYALIAWGQLHAMRTIAGDNSKQTQELIGAATQMKNAGWVFSGAAQGINNAGWNAVGKLNAQAESTSKVAHAAASQSKNTAALVAAQQAQVATLQKQILDFEDSQSGQLVIEDFAETPTSNKNVRKVQFRLVNRGNSVISRIGVASGGSNSNLRPDFQKIRLFMNQPSGPNPLGFDLPPGKDKLEELDLTDLDTIEARKSGWVFWEKYAGVDIFNRVVTKPVCYYYHLKFHRVESCPVDLTPTPSK